MELEQSLAHLRLSIHFARDQMHQLEMAMAAMPGNSPTTTADSGRESSAAADSLVGGDLDDEAYVPFEG